MLWLSFRMQFELQVLLQVLYIVVTSVNADFLFECYSYLRNVLGNM